MHQCLVHRTVAGKIAFHPGRKVNDNLPCTFFLIFQPSWLPENDPSGREFLLYNLLLMLSTSQYHLFEQQYPQNINSVQENMSYGTSENSYKK